MADELSADLELSIKDALGSVDDLRAEIEKMTREASGNFEDEFAKAITGVPDVVITPDVEKVEPEIATAIATVDTTLPVVADPDVTAIAPAIDTAIGDANSIVNVDADTTLAETAIAAVTTDTTSTLNVDADTTQALGSVEDLVAEADKQNVELGVTLDTSQAQQAMDDLTSTSDDAGDSLNTTAAASTALGSAVSLSTGSVDALTNTAGNLASQMGGTAAAFAGGIFAIGTFTNQAVQSEGATERLSRTFGDLATQVSTINVGDLNVGLQQLAIETGSSGSAMKNAASDAFQMATSFGVGRDASAQYSEQILALAARAVALNPELGETGAVADRLSTAMQTARDRSLRPFALGITSVEINTRAASIALADGRDTVTAADKAMAGAALATEKLGTHLKQDIAEGAQDPILALRSLTKEFLAVTTEAGKPLIAPMIEALQSSLPTVQAFATSLGLLAQSALPILTAGLQAIAPVITAFADGLAALGPDGIQAVAVIAAIGYAVSSLSDVFNVFEGALTVVTGIMEANPFVLMATGLAIAVTALGIFSGGSDTAAQSTKQLTDAIVAQNGALDSNSLDLVKKGLGDLIENLTKAGINFTTYTRALDTATESSKKQRDALDALPTSFTTITEHTGTFVSMLKEANPALGELADRLNKSGELTVDMARKLVEQARAAADAGKQTHDFAQAQVDQASATNFAKETTDAATKALKDHHTAQFDALATTQATTLATQQQAAVDAVAVSVSQQRAQATRSAADGEAAYSTEVFASSVSTDFAAQAVYRYYTNQGTAKEATDAVAESISALRQQLDLLLGNYISAEQAQGQLTKALDDINISLITGKTSIADYTKNSTDASLSLLGVGSNAESAAEAILKQTHSFDQAVVPLQSYRDELVNIRDQLAAAGLDTRFVDGLLSQVDAAITKVKEQAPAAKDAGHDVGQGVTDGATDGLSGLDPATAAAVRAAGMTVVAATPQYTGAGYGLGDATATGVGAAAGALSAAAGGLAGVGPPALASHWQEYKDTGLSLGLAVGEGLAASAVQVAQYADAVSAGAVAAIHAGIENPPFPSRVGRRLGQSLGYGFAVGITDHSDTAAASGTAAVAAATAAMGYASSPFMPNLPKAGLDNHAADFHGAPIQFNIEVHGVTNPDVGRAVGEQIGEGASEALARRGYVTTARFG